MMRNRPWPPRHWGGWLFLLGAFLIWPAPVQALTDEQIRTAMQRLEEYFWSIQDPVTGGWPLPQYARGDQAGGDTALIVNALLHLGVSPQHPRLAQAIAFLEASEFRGTYAVALRAHVWAQLPDAYRPQLVADAQWLVSAADDRGCFGYTANRFGAINHSTTHFGILGLWEAAKRGFQAPPQFWSKAEQYFLDVQQGDGGWAYQADGNSYGSMTMAGLTMLLITQQQARRGDMRPREELAAGINRGLNWLDRHFDGAANPMQHAQWNYYYLYAVERVALASGRRLFNSQDWFEVGAEHLLQLQRNDGSINGDPIDSAFALLFLARGRIPVWITKLEVPGFACNNRPNDIYFLTDYLSDLREGELNWQSVSLDTPLGPWHSAPLAYLASDRRVELSAEQKDRLKRYLDLGGTLLANPDAGGSGLIHTIRELAQELYPQYPIRLLGDDHLIFSALQPVPRGSMQKVYGVSNGARELILLPERDWGIQWQTSRSPGRTAVWNVITNVWAVVTDRGLLPPRVEPRIDDRRQRPSTGVFPLGRIRYEGNWSPEPAAWDVFDRHLFNHTGLELRVAEIDLDDLGECGLKLVHLAGVQPVELTAGQLEAIRRYVKGGGTLLVETVGGRSDFARSVEAQLGAAFGQGAQPISAESPLISGRGIEEAFDNREVRYRRYAVAMMSPGIWPRWAGLFLDDRPAIIFSHEDLSQGLLHVNHWGVIGYSPQSATRLMINLVLFLHRP